MNADINNLNVKIYNELLKLAKSYFNEISGKWIAKSYDAKEAIKALCLYSKESGLRVVERTCNYYVDKGILKKDPLILSANPRNASLLDHATIVQAYNSGKQFSISVDSFKCSFDACKVFDYLLKFEKLAGIPAKEKAVFIKNVSEKETTNQEKVISFDIDIDKKALPACKHIANDDLRPVMNNIFVDVNSKLLVASDAHILSEYPVNIYNVEGETDNKSIFIAPEVLKKCIGTCHVDVYLVKEDTWCPQCLTVITNDKGETFKNNTPGKFPNYKSVLPTLYTDGFIQIEPGDVKRVLSFMKTCKSVKGSEAVLFTIVKDQSSMTLSYINDYSKANKLELKVNLKAPALASMNIKFSYNSILRMGNWTGGMWLVDSFTAAIFDDKSALLNLLMPCTISHDLRSNIKSGERVQAEERYGKREPEAPEANNEVIKTEAKPEAKTEAKSGAKTEAGPEVETGAKTEAKPGAKTEVETGAKPEAHGAGTDKIALSAEADKDALSAGTSKADSGLKVSNVPGVFNYIEIEARSKASVHAAVRVPLLIDADIISLNAPSIPGAIAARMFYPLLLATMGYNVSHNYTSITSGPPGKHPTANKTTGLCRCGP